MNFDLTDDQRMLQEGAARYFEKSYDFKVRLDRARNGGGFARATWQEFADMGWLAAAIPEAHGGLGFGPVEVGADRRGNRPASRARAVHGVLLVPGETDPAHRYRCTKG